MREHEKVGIYSTKRVYTPFESITENDRKPIF